MQAITAAACEAVAKGSAILGNMFFTPLEELELKFKAGDGDTPVTVIDRAVGLVVREVIRRHRPDDAIYDEEAGFSPGSTGYLWYVDPLDGTSNVSPRFPQSVVGVTVSYKGEEVVAAVGNPFEDTIIFGERGVGAFKTNLAQTKDLIRLSVSKERQPRSRIVVVDALWNERTATPKSSFLKGVAEHAMNVRMFGSSIYAWTLLAEGRVDAVIVDAIGGFWDITPGIVLVLEAGGQITGIHGNLPMKGDHVVLGTNGEELHSKILLLLQSCYQGYGGFR